MSERAVLIRLRPGLYRAYSRNTGGRSYKIHVALLKIHGWSATCDCPGHLSHKHCYHAEEAAQKEYEYMTTELTGRAQEMGVVVYERLPVPNLDPNTIIPSNILPSPGEIAAMAHIANLMTPDTEDPRETFKKELAGWELGVGPMTAIRRMFTVNNKIEPDTQLMLALALAGDSTLTVAVDGDATSCTATLKRSGVKHAPITYTMKDADASGQSKLKRRYNKLKKTWEDAPPGPWQLYPKDMLRHAAVKRVLRLYAPDLINNVKGVGIGAAEVMIAGPAEDVIDAVVMEEHGEQQADASPLPTHAPGDGPRPDEVPGNGRGPLDERLSADSLTGESGEVAVDRTDYRAALKALLEEAKANTDDEFFAAIMAEFREAYQYAILIVGNKPQLQTAKLRVDDAKSATERLWTRLYGDGPSDAEKMTAATESVIAATTAAAEALDPDDQSFE